MKRFVFVVVAVFAQTLAAAPEQAPPVTLTVEVINRTIGGKDVTGDEILVEIYEDGTPTTILQATLGDKDSASFEKVPTGDHITAAAKVKHQSMSFSGEPFALTPQQTPITTYVEVYDVSTEVSQLRAVTHHMKLTQQGKSIVVSEFIQLRNPTDKAITSEHRDKDGRATVLSISLPKGYRDFSSSHYLVSEALVFTEEGFHDTMAVPPGDHQVAFSYHLDTASGKAEFNREIPLSTKDLVVYSALGKGAVQGLGQASGEVTLTEGIAAEYFNLGARPGGAEVEFRIAGLSVDRTYRNTWVIIGALFVVMMVLAVGRMYTAENPKSGSS